MDDNELAKEAAKLAERAVSQMPTKTKAKLLDQLKSAKSPEEYNAALQDLANCLVPAMADFLNAQLKRQNADLAHAAARLDKAQNKHVRPGRKQYERDILLEELKETKEGMEKTVATLQRAIDDLHHDTLNYAFPAIKAELSQANKALYGNLSKSLDYYKDELKRLDAAKAAGRKPSMAAKIFFSAARLIPGLADAFAATELANAKRRKAIEGLISNTQRFMGKLESKFPEVKGPQKDAKATKQLIDMDAAATLLHPEAAAHAPEVAAELAAKGKAGPVSPQATPAGDALTASAAAPCAEGVVADHADAAAMAQEAIVLQGQAPDGAEPGSGAPAPGGISPEEDAAIAATIDEMCGTFDDAPQEPSQTPSKAQVEEQTQQTTLTI